MGALTQFDADFLCITFKTFYLHLRWKFWSKQTCKEDLAWSLNRNKNSYSEWENCHVTEKSEATAQCKEMPVILVNKVVDQKIIIRKGSREEEEEE
jgi:hypothetical protein